MTQTTCQQRDHSYRPKDASRACMSCGRQPLLNADRSPHDIYAYQSIRACEDCGEADISPNVEAFEISGKTVCDECAEEIFEENSQFGVGA